VIVVLAGSVSQFHIFLDAKMAKQNACAVLREASRVGYRQFFCFCVVVLPTFLPSNAFVRFQASDDSLVSWVIPTIMTFNRARLE
jgi:hypothetical protein